MGNLEEVAAINITPQDVTSDSNTVNTSFTTQEVDLQEVLSVNTKNKYTVPISTCTSLDIHSLSSVDGTPIAVTPVNTSSEDTNAHPTQLVGLQDITTSGNSASQDTTNYMLQSTHGDPDSVQDNLHDVSTGSQNTSLPLPYPSTNTPNMGDMSLTESSKGSALLSKDNLELETGSQDITLHPRTELQDTTVSDPVTKRRKEHLWSLGLSDSVYSSNSDVFYPVLTPEQDEVDYISFKDIIDTTWSILSPLTI